MTRWNIRDAWSGKLLDFIETADIDYALARARKRHHHNVTVDNLAPRAVELFQLRKLSSTIRL